MGPLVLLTIETLKMKYLNITFFHTLNKRLSQINSGAEVLYCCQLLGTAK